MSLDVESFLNFRKIFFEPNVVAFAHQCANTHGPVEDFPQLVA